MNYIALIWNWYEVAEGIFVSLLFILLPLLWRIESHHLELRRHAEHQTMLAEEQHYQAVHDAPHPRVLARERAGEAKTPEL